MTARGRYGPLPVAVRGQANGPSSLSPFPTPCGRRLHRPELASHLSASNWDETMLLIKIDALLKFWQRWRAQFYAGQRRAEIRVIRGAFLPNPSTGESPLTYRDRMPYLARKAGRRVHPRPSTCERPNAKRALGMQTYACTVAVAVGELSDRNGDTLQNSLANSSGMFRSPIRTQAQRCKRGTCAKPREDELVPPGAQMAPAAPVAPINSWRAACRT